MWHGKGVDRIDGTFTSGTSLNERYTKMGSTKIQQQPQADYGKQMSDTLRAQRDSMQGTGSFADLGPMWQAEAAERPNWTNLELQTMRDLMEGRDGNMGLLGMYKNVITPSLSETEAGANRYGRMSDLADVSSMGQTATDAFLNADPMKKEASDLLLRGAIDDFQLGSKLDPSLAREVQQGYRNAASARGIAQSPYSAQEEAYWQGLQANQLKQQRQSALSQLMGQRQALTGDPFMQVLGRQGQAFGSAGGYGGQAMGMGQALGPRIYNPESQASFDLAAGNRQRNLAVAQANQAGSNAMKAGAMQAAGSILGGFAAGCHVAREVYGEENPKWVEFFVWKETEGPRWFKALYNEYSEQWAAFIRNKPRIKNLIRNWMDRKIRKA